jgi:hypothetical protein
MGAFSTLWVVVQIGVPNPIECTGPRSQPCRASVKVRVPNPLEPVLFPRSRPYRAYVQVRVPDPVERWFRSAFSTP